MSDQFVGQIVLDRRDKFGDHRTNRSREIPPEAVGGGVFDGFEAITSDRKWIMTSYQVLL